jgi:Major Facilitator Superfamily
MRRVQSSNFSSLAVAGVLFGAGWGSNQFTPMLLVYSRDLGLGTGTLEAMFGFYALGLIPGLLLAGPLSDARGRRAVVRSAAVVSLLATAVLVAGGEHVALLFAGRLLTGLAVGAIFGVGTAWLRELSTPPLGSLSEHGAARRVAVAMTAGFALGPLLAGSLAQWAPMERRLPYAPHLVLMALVVVGLVRAPETIHTRDRRPPRLIPAAARSARFRRVVGPMAPWIFVAPGVAFALLPNVVGTAQEADGIALTAGITAVTALSGVLVQPFARRLDAGGEGNPAAGVGLVVLAAGLGLAALTAAAQSTWLLVPTAVLLGCAYGIGLVAGLVEVQRIADPAALASLTAVFYALSYLGFAAPFLFALGAHLAAYATLLTASALLALATAWLIASPSRATAATVHTGALER